MKRITLLKSSSGHFYPVTEALKRRGDMRVVEGAMVDGRFIPGAEREVTPDLPVAELSRSPSAQTDEPAPAKPTKTKSERAPRAKPAKAEAPAEAPAEAAPAAEADGVPDFGFNMPD